MTVKLELSPADEKALRRKAARLGMELDAYLRRLLERDAATDAEPKSYASLDAIKREGGYSGEWTDEDIEEFGRDTMNRAPASLGEDD